MEGSEEDRKIRKSLRLPRQLLNSCDQNADSDMESEGMYNAVLYGNEKLIGNCSKGHFCYVLAKSLYGLCPYPEDQWNFELGRDDLV